MNIDSRNSIEDIVADPELMEQLKKLVLERVNVMPDTMRIAVGEDDFTKSDIMRHIKEEDEVGKQMMEIELGFLRDLASGAIYAHE